MAGLSSPDTAAIANRAENLSLDKVRPMKSGRLLSLNTSRAKPVTINGRKVMTAIGKLPVDGERAVLPLGIEGDEQADLTVHGGLAKAIYAYPSEHYGFWRTVRAQAQVALWDEALPMGSLGENLTLAGITESELWIGDVLAFPNCQLAVSEPRLPCFKFNAAMGFAHAAKLMAESAWCGSYLAVRAAGTISAGQEFTLVPGPREVGISELFRARMGRAAGSR
jgi:MOSC domain-containing protein YiiM